MTTRERFMAGGVLSLILLGGGAFLFNLFFLDPLASRRRAIETLRGEISRKQERIQQVRAEKAKLEGWREQSLPGDTDTEMYSSTRRLYQDYLHDLLVDSELASPNLKIMPQKPNTSSSPMLPGKKPIYTRLTFTVDEARGSLDKVVNFLERFYHTGMLHQIKKLIVQRPRTRTGQQPDDLDVSMTIEALVVNNATPRPYLPYVDRRLVAIDTLTNLRGGPGGLGLALVTAGPAGNLGPPPLAVPHRRYEDVASNKNVFFPPEEKTESDIEVTRFVYLTDITHNDQDAHGHEHEAWLYDRTSNLSTRLRVRRGFDSFRITDDKGETLVRGTVLRLDSSDVYFTADGKYYAIHVGHNLDEALRNPLPESKVRELKAGPGGTEHSFPPPPGGPGRRGEGPRGRPGPPGPNPPPPGRGSE
jgi:hypothetical protein